jgi:hypothetical protein
MVNIPINRPQGLNIGKISKRSVFDLKDMLAAVENAEEESLNIEKSKFFEIEHLL